MVCVIHTRPRDTATFSFKLYPDYVGSEPFVLRTGKAKLWLKDEKFTMGNPRSKFLITFEVLNYPGFELPGLPCLGRL